MPQKAWQRFCLGLMSVPLLGPSFPHKGQNKIGAGSLVLEAPGGLAPETTMTLCLLSCTHLCPCASGLGRPKRQQQMYGGAVVASLPEG
jgi:hypothetical protein